MKLTIQNGRFSYNDETVLSDISLEIVPGEVLTVIGPSGSGKSTLLRLAALFDSPDDGTVHCNDVDPWRVDDQRRLELRRRIGMVFQDANLFDTTVERNVASGLLVRRTWRERLAGFGKQLLPASLASQPLPSDPVREALSIVDLEGYRERDARSLSGGEAQRVSFARALATEPDLLVLDEPTSDLDPRNTALLEQAIDRSRDRGHGVVLATHDMHQARRLSDRVAFLFEGELIEVGPPEQVFEDPDNPRTARFVRGDLLYAPDELERERQTGDYDGYTNDRSVPETDGDEGTAPVSRQ